MSTLEEGQAGLRSIQGISNFSHSWGRPLRLVCGSLSLGCSLVYGRVCGLQESELSPAAGPAGEHGADPRAVRTLAAKGHLVMGWNKPLERNAARAESCTVQEARIVWQNGDKGCQGWG